MNERQLEVLRWIGDGCPAGRGSADTYKLSAYALANRGLADVKRTRGRWAATITDDGRYYLEHGQARPPLRPRRKAGDAVESRRPGRPSADTDPAPIVDGTARALRRVAARRRPSEIKHSTRQIQESYVRYKVIVTRVQVAERFVRASSAEDAADKAQAEFDKPYGYFGSWKTTGS